MRKGFIVALLLGAFVIGYRHYVRSYEPEKQYKEFAEAVLHRQYDKAAAMADGLSAADIERNGSQEHIGGGPAMFQTLFPSKFNVELTERSGDDVTIHATQTIIFNPPGVESGALRAAMYARMRQITTLRKAAGGWKVVAFNNTFD
jgi:hypothetical protein